MPALDPSKILFTPQQETDLGDAVAAQFQSNFLVIDDDDVTGYLRRVGERVVRHLPETNLHYQFYLYDLPELQSFGMPGGRIYVARKLVAFLRSEDELAGLLGHELGHIVARQPAVDMSRLFRERLGVQRLGDREDVFDKYNQLLETARTRRGGGHSQGESQKEQLVADQIGVEAAARAGYSPQGLAGFFDRLAQTKGKTGNWFSDLFGATPPDSRRLRELLKVVSSLPAACMEAQSPEAPDEFRQWQANVLRYSGIGHKEKLQGVLLRERLKDALRGDIEHFRFSFDGKYLLAQDDAEIYVLTRDPFEFVFRIDAPGGMSAEFSPDSRRIIFYTAGLRVETWDIERQERISLVDVTVPRGCRQSALSPDGEVLACYGGKFDLSLYEVASSEPIFQKEKFHDPSDVGFSFARIIEFMLLLRGFPILKLHFSPDGRYFVAVALDGTDLVVDVTNRKTIGVPGSVHDVFREPFTFLGPDRIVSVKPSKPESSPIVQFPSGEALDHIPLGSGTLTAASNPRYILIRPVQSHPVGVYDVQAKKIVNSNRMAAMDVWADTAVAERLNGEIGLYAMGQVTSSRVAQLPMGKLGPARALAISPDLKWLALSSRTRGAVWNLEANERVFYVRSFTKAYFRPDGILFAEFPKFEKTGRELVALNPVTKDQRGRPVEEDEVVQLFGKELVRITPLDKNKDMRHNVRMDVMDTESGKMLWTRMFPKRAPTFGGSLGRGRIILSWVANSDGARGEIEGDAKLKERWSRAGVGENDYFVEVVESRSGTVLGSAMVLTGKGSIELGSIDSAGDWIIVADRANRVLLYSLADGLEKKRWFGSLPVASIAGDRLCLTNERGRLTLYDLRSLQRAGELQFANRVSVNGFSSDGRKLFVLTDDQTAFVIDSGAFGGTPTASSAQ